MRQLPPEIPFVDDEGFPQGMAVRNLQRSQSRDGESGELLTTKVCVIRGAPKPRPSPRLDYLLLVGDRQCCVRDKQRFRGFKIHESIQGVSWAGHRQRSPGHYQEPRLRACAHLKRGPPVPSFRQPRVTPGPSCRVIRKEEYPVKQIFRVPKNILRGYCPEKPRRGPNAMCVSIWEEFLFGKCVIQGDKGQKSREDEEDEGPIKFIHRILCSVLPRRAVDFMMYTLYFVLFYATCCIYNTFWHLFTTILLMEHLKIHERAYSKKIDVEFTGSVFQGPLYAMTRSWCRHCVQREDAKVMMSLMKKMKSDILGSENTGGSLPDSRRKTARE